MNNTNININDKSYNLNNDRDTFLFEILRSKLKLKGSKFGFGLEQCGACLIIVDLEVDDFGNIKLKRAIIVADAVKIIDPKGLISQLKGGFIQSA
tara:strand:- start:1728 stop:2012 length:285 start_codon:yes stop_codon:yes gene_type:complete